MKRIDDCNAWCLEVMGGSTRTYQVGAIRKRPGVVRVASKATSRFSGCNDSGQIRLCFFAPTLKSGRLELAAPAGRNEPPLARPELVAPTGRSGLCFLARTDLTGRPELVAPAGRI